MYTMTRRYGEGVGAQVGGGDRRTIPSLSRQSGSWALFDSRTMC
jgi:hypothetical protein